MDWQLIPMYLIIAGNVNKKLQETDSLLSVPESKQKGRHRHWILHSFEWWRVKDYAYLCLCHWWWSRHLLFWQLSATPCGRHASVWAVCQSSEDHRAQWSAAWEGQGPSALSSSEPRSQAASLSCLGGCTEKQKYEIKFKLQILSSRPKSKQLR